MIPIQYEVTYNKQKFKKYVLLKMINELLKIALKFPWFMQNNNTRDQGDPR